MKLLLTEIRRSPLLWLLAFVPVVFVVAHFMHGSPVLVFALSVLAIVPLAALLSHATESVAAKTGDSVGGLLNATLGNLTELVIALAALKAGEYMLVKASIAGAIVTNAMFMLGALFLLGGLKHHVQEFNRAGARLQAGLLLLATVALLIPSAVGSADSGASSAFAEKLSVCLFPAAGIRDLERAPGEREGAVLLSIAEEVLARPLGEGLAAAALRQFERLQFAPDQRHVVGAVQFEA